MTLLPRVAVVVLNWNNADDTLECLTSLLRSAEPLQVVVVDNASTDGSAEIIERSGLASSVLRSSDNSGYAAGNNQGLREVLAAGYEYVAVLNNDTVASVELFSTLVAHLDRHSEPLAVSPAIFYYDEPDVPWFAGGVVERGWPRHLQPAELASHSLGLKTTEWISGCCIIAHRDIWLEVGLFDPDYFLIFEDCDWSFRALAKQVNLCVAMDARLLHKVSRSFRSRSMQLLGTYYFVRNGIRFVLRYQRQDLVNFLRQWVIGPTLTSIRRRSMVAETLFAWAGAVAVLMRQTGRAPSGVERLSYRLVHRASQHD